MTINRSIVACCTLLTLTALSCGPSLEGGTGSGGGGGSLNVGGGSGGGRGTGGSGGTGGGAGPGSGGATCASANDCPYFYCLCISTTTPVNSRTCLNQQCASVSTACNNGCASFSGWTGKTFSSGGSGGGAGTSSGQPGSFCASRFDCLAQACGCTDGAVLNVRDCLNDVCNSRASTCQSACVDTNHGNWDGR